MFSRQHINFLLHEVFEVEALNQYPYFTAHDAETFGMVLDVAEEIATKILQPAFVDSDRQPAELKNGQVEVHKDIANFVRSYAESGLLSATFSEEFEGQQLPKSVYAAAEYICMASHNSFVMFTDLITGCSNLIATFGTTEQKKIFIPKLLSGQWFGTMCLTEPQAGSSLADISTTAYSQADGTYKIIGQKIFISAGDHQLGENIIHLVLARIEGSPQGTKGISLFIVPKYSIELPKSEIINPKSNDVSPIGIYHKMGQKASPTMHLAFGENNNCTGYLLGEANKGLSQMFQMMNGARLGVGLTGIACASAAYQVSKQYAQERPQGRNLRTGKLCKIIEHPDIRRMLQSQKAIYEGGLALMLQCYLYLDLYKVNENKEKYDALLELLTPVAKTYGSEMGIVAVNQGLQVLGGYGYTDDFVLEQLARDVRITSIYEGTTGIQAQALLGRQISRNNGLGLELWKLEVLATIENAKHFAILLPFVQELTEAIETFEHTTTHLLSKSDDTAVFLSDANVYMEFFGILNVAWQWLKMGVAATEKLNTEPKAPFYASKIHTMRFFYKYELPKVYYLAKCLQNPEVLTVFEAGEELIL